VLTGPALATAFGGAVQVVHEDGYYYARPGRS